MTSIAGYAERRLGFNDTVETTPTTFNNQQRNFTWNRFDGSFYAIACDINSSGFAQVFKYAYGVDTSFVSIFTDTTANPFWFVTSNNTLYFSNGNVAKKWDPINGVSNWGIAIGSVNDATGPDTAGTGANSGSGTAWTNPTNVTSASSYATVSLSPGGSSQNLNATQFSFGVPGTTSITGIGITFDTQSNLPGAGFISAQLLKNGTPVGTPKTWFFATSGNTLGGAADLWGATWTANDVNQSTWGVQIYTQNPTIGTGNFGVRNVKATIYGLGGPAATVSSSSGTFSATTGYQYEFCYGNSNTGHVSSPTPPSSSTGSFSSKANVAVQLTASTDPQVNQIRAFRSTDSVAAGTNAGVYFELPTSPYPNIGWTFTSVANAAGGSTVYTGTPTGSSGFAASVGQTFQVAGFSTGANNGSFPCTASSATTLTLTNGSGAAETHAATGILLALDNAADTSLQVINVAPIAGFNDPPTPFNQPVYFSGRLWGFINNRVWFSGLEEILIGVPEESFPSGPAGNYWTFDEPVTGLASVGANDDQALAIFCGGKIYCIVGNSLDTFRRFRMDSKHGCRNASTLTVLGTVVIWLDSSNQIWLSDGTSLQELSIDIRPDIAGVTASSCSMTSHVAGKKHWIVFSTGSKLFCYDMDTEQWMPPWNFATQNLWSGEISPGVYKLMAATTTEALQLSDTVHKDNGNTYTPIAQTSNMALVPDFGTRFSSKGLGTYDEPSRTGAPWYFNVDTNAIVPSDVAVLVDDDPLNASSTYNSIASQATTVQNAFNRNNGTFLTQNVYGMNGTNTPQGRWASVKITGANADDNLRLYSWFLGYEQRR